MKSFAKSRFFFCYGKRSKGHCCKGGICCTVGAGYKEALESQFFGTDGGLRRRFKEIPFSNFNDFELYKIFCLKGKEILKVTSENGRRALLWLHAGFTAPNINGSFPVKLISALRQQYGALPSRAHVAGMAVPENLSERDILVAWLSVLTEEPFHLHKGSKDFGRWAEQILSEPPINLLEAVKLQKVNAYAGSIMRRLKLHFDPFTEIPRAFDCTGDGSEGMLALWEHLDVREFVLEGRDNESYTFEEKNCTWEQALSAHLAICTLNGLAWTTPDSNQTCLLVEKRVVSKEKVRPRSSSVERSEPKKRVKEVLLVEVDAADKILEIRNQAFKAKKEMVATLA
jgi:hypothetical protein